MPDDRHVDRRCARVDAGERDRPQGRARVAAGAAREPRPQRAGSSASPRIVFTSESPSAPAATTARADSAMSHCAGESFA